MPNAYAHPVREIDAENAWLALWAGEWTVVDHLEGPPSPAIVCDPARSQPVTPLLSRGEIELAVGRAQGGTLKAMAADSGRSVTTVSNLLARVTLSVAERTVALDLLDGASRRDIAFARGTSPRTVANQMASIFRKLRVSSRVELLAVLRSRQSQDAP